MFTRSIFVRRKSHGAVARILAIPISWGLLLAPSLSAGDLSSYREFQLGTDLTTVAEQVGMDTSKAKAIHQRPAVIQELEWRPRPSRNYSPAGDPVEKLVFSFYNGQLFRMVVNYDRSRTEGLTVEDMIEALSANYGAGTTPAAEVIFPTIFNESVKVIARWEDSRYSFNLVRSSYLPSFGMVLFSKRLDELAQAATAEAIRIDKQEAPQRAIESEMREAEENRLHLENAREVNKESFRP